MSNREDMIAEATDLGLDFKGNISNIKLATLINEYKGLPIPHFDTPAPSPAVKAEPKPEPEDEVAADKPDNLTHGQRVAQARYTAKRQKIAAAKKKANIKQIVTITNRDNRENDVATTAFLSYENQYFGMAKNVPLDIPVELEAALISIAETTKMTHHRDEIVNGRRTGNKLTSRVKKYAVSYGKHQQ